MATEDENTQEPSKRSPLEEAQLRKLELEIRALERAADDEESVGFSKQEKIKLEVKTLLWQTGRVYRLSQFAVIFSILATMVTIFATGYGLWSSYVKDNETRIKEREDKTDGLYRTAVQQLIRFPSDEKLTITEVVFTLRDLEDVVKNNYNDDERKRVRQEREVGYLLAQLINSPDVSLGVTRNVELDRKAMDQSSSYRDYLRENPKFNRDLISKYKNVLSGIHDKAPCYSMIRDPNREEYFLEIECKNGEPEPTFLQYSALYYGYRSHVAILNETMEQIPAAAEEARSYRDSAFCWYFRATRGNLSLTSGIFGGTSDQINWKWTNECMESQQ